MRIKCKFLTLIVPLLILVSCSSQIANTENFSRSNDIGPNTSAKSQVDSAYQLTETEQVKILPTNTPVIFDEPEGKSVLSTPTMPVTAADAYDNFSSIYFQPWELITSITWSHDGRYLVISAGTVIYIYDVETQKFIGSYQVKALTHTLDISQDGKWLVAGSRDGIIRVWQFDQIIEDLASGTEMHPAYQIDAHKKGINSVSFINPDHYLATAGNDGIIRIWDLANQDMVSSMIGGNYAIPSIAYSHQYDYIAIANNTIIRLRNLQTLKIEGTLRAPTNLYSIAFNPVGNLIIAGDIANHIYIWNIVEANQAGEKNNPQPLIILGPKADENAYQGLVWQVKFHPNGKVIASAGGDKSVRLWNVYTGELLDEFYGHSAGVTSIAFHPNGSVLVSGGLDGILNFWNIKLPEVLPQDDDRFR